jgi:hypothetical protein
MKTLFTMKKSNIEATFRSVARQERYREISFSPISFG